MSEATSVPTWGWYELMTTDTAAAVAFYTRFLPWKTEAWPDPQMNYTILSSASGGLGGVTPQAEQAAAMGAPPAWVGVVYVPSVDGAVAKALELGGVEYVPAMDIPGVGRYAVLADPTGAVFTVLQPSGPGELPSTHELGRVSWNELWSSDPDAAFAFYAALFGWVETGTMDMGEQGIYRMYGVPGGTQSLGGIAQKMPDQPVSAWCFYFNVTNVDDAVSTITGAGGRIVMGPQDVPGTGRIAIGLDPQGAAFAIYAHGTPAV